MQGVMMGLPAGRCPPEPAPAEGWIVQREAFLGWTRPVTCAPGASGQTGALCLCLGCDPRQDPHALHLPD